MSPRREIDAPTGVRPCACRDCFELTYAGGARPLCHECEGAGCEPDAECQAPGAYGCDDLEPGAAADDEAPR